jgi:hypothetical protein
VAWKTIAQTPKPNKLMNPNEMNTLEHIAYVRLALMLASAGCVLIAASLWASVFCDWRKVNRK